MGEAVVEGDGGDVGEGDGKEAAASVVPKLWRRPGPRKGGGKGGGKGKE